MALCVYKKPGYEAEGNRVNKGDFCLIGPFMSHITHAQMFCYSKFKMAARSGNLHADRYLTICARIGELFLRLELSI